MKLKSAAPVYTEVQAEHPVLNCPPHHWMLESPEKGRHRFVGRCRKCRAITFFSGVLEGPPKHKPPGRPKTLIPDDEDA